MVSVGRSPARRSASYLPVSGRPWHCRRGRPLARRLWRVRGAAHWPGETPEPAGPPPPGHTEPDPGVAQPAAAHPERMGDEQLTIAFYLGRPLGVPIVQLL